MSQNFVSEHVASSTWTGWWCAGSSTTIDRVGPVTRTETLYSNRTAYSDEIRDSIASAFVPSWDRYPIQVSPAELNLMASVGDTALTRVVEVENTDCYSTVWWLESEAEWLSASPAHSITRTQVLLSIDVASLPKGLYSTTFRIDHDPPIGRLHREVPVRVWVLDRVYRVHLPLASRKTR
jgi:hypothetical protein